MLIDVKDGLGKSYFGGPIPIRTIEDLSSILKFLPLTHETHKRLTTMMFDSLRAYIAKEKISLEEFKKRINDRKISTEILFSMFEDFLMTEPFKQFGLELNIVLIRENS